MKRSLLALGFSVFSILLWFGLRSESSTPPISAKREALPLVPQKLTTVQTKADLVEHTLSSNTYPAETLPVVLPITPASNDGAALEADLQIPTIHHAISPGPRSLKGRSSEGEQDALPHASMSDTSVHSSELIAAARPQPPLRPVPSIRYPLALQEISPTVALSPEIKAGLTEIADNFVDAVGGEDQDAGDPAYRARWLAQQATADQNFKTLYGTQAWQQLQNNTAHDATQPPPEINSEEPSAP
jgi:hypothetical protein